MGLQRFYDVKWNLRCKRFYNGLLHCTLYNVFPRRRDAGNPATRCGVRPRRSEPPPKLPGSRNRRPHEPYRGQLGGTEAIPPSAASNPPELDGSVCPWVLLPKKHRRLLLYVLAPDHWSPARGLVGKLHFYIVKSDVTVFYDVKSNVKLFYNVKSDVKLFFSSSRRIQKLLPVLRIALNVFFTKFSGIYLTRPSILDLQAIPWDSTRCDGHSHRLYR